MVADTDRVISPNENALEWSLLPGNVLLYRANADPSDYLLALPNIDTICHFHTSHVGSVLKVVTKDKREMGFFFPDHARLSFGVGIAKISVPATSAECYLCLADVRPLPPQFSAPNYPPVQRAPGEAQPGIQHTADEISSKCDTEDIRITLSTIYGPHKQNSGPGLLRGDADEGHGEAAG